MALKKKAKSIQRERKAKPSTLEQNTNIGEGAQQQVVKVIIQQPEQPKPRKRASKAESRSKEIGSHRRS
jgi:ribulose bisphosphate carboxylase small subunit